MRALLQRVSRASVTVEGRKVGRIGPGLVILLGVAHRDSSHDARLLAQKVAYLRIFPNQEGRLHFSLLDTGGQALIVSQFTLLADTHKGRRPSFTDAAPPDQAKVLYEQFVGVLGDIGVKVVTGHFQELMQVELINDGPVTLLLDTQD